MVYWVHNGTRCVTKNHSIEKPQTQNENFRKGYEKRADRQRI